MARGRHDYEKSVISVESEGFQNPHGRILMYDDFEDTPLKWTTLGTGTWFISRQARAAYNRSYGLELDITSDAPPGSRYAQANRYIPMDVTERILLEMFWRANDLTALERLSIELYRRTGTQLHYGSVRYNGIAEYWEYRPVGGIPQYLPGSDQRFTDEAWNELTLAMDFSTAGYITFKSNNMEINMGGTACQTTGNLLPPYMQTTITAATTTGDQLLVDVDDVVVRELEV